MCRAGSRRPKRLRASDRRPGAMQAVGYARRHRALRPLADRAQIRRDIRVSWIATGWWALTLSLVWWTPWIQILWFLTFAVGIIATWALSRSTRKRRAPEAVESPE